MQVHGTMQLSINTREICVKAQKDVCGTKNL